MATIAPHTYFDERGRTPARFERDWPKRLDGFMGTASYKRSLGTKDKKEALRKRVEKEAEFDAICAEADQAKAAGWTSFVDYQAAVAGGETPPAGFVKVTNAAYTAALIRHFETARDTFADHLRDSPPASLTEAATRVSGFHHPLATTLRSEDASFGADLDAAGIDPYAPPPAFTLSRMLEALQASSIAIDPADLLNRRHWRGFARASRGFIGLRDAVLLEHAGDTDTLSTFVEAIGGFFGLAQATTAVAGPVAPQPAPIPLPVPTKVKLPLFSAALADMLKSGDQRAATKTAIGQAAKLFVEVVGNKRLDEITRADARAFQDTLRLLPPNWRKRKDMAGLTAPAAARLAEKLNLTPADAATIRKVFGFVSSAFKSIHNRYRDDLAGNPFDGLDLPKKKNADGRSPFTTAELQAMFASPIYAGMRSRARWTQAGNVVDRTSWRFWAPLIGLHTGMRLGEIIQLRVGDIGEKFDIPFVSIAPGGNDGAPPKTVKTPSSVRTIPLHQTLIDIGLLKFVEERREAGAVLLFADAEISGDGKWSSTPSKFFNRWLTECGVKRKDTTFHSLRHTVEDALGDAEAPQYVIDLIQGHKLAGMGGVYGKREHFHARAKAINAATFPGLDLSHLKPSKVVQPNNPERVHNTCT